MPSAMREVYLESPDVEWNDIGGLDEVKRELQEAVEWPLRYPDLYTQLGSFYAKRNSYAWSIRYRKNYAC